MKKFYPQEKQKTHPTHTKVCNSCNTEFIKLLSHKSTPFDKSKYWFCATASRIWEETYKIVNVTEQKLTIEGSVDQT